MYRILFYSFSFFFYLLQGYSQPGNLVWEDNFNQGSLNPEYWNVETGTGVNGDWGTGQLDRATSRPENIHFAENIPGAEDACLVITTQKEFYIDRQFTSGRINTSGKKSWGPGHRLVARIWPRDVRYKGQGFAFWTMPDEIPQGWSYIMWPQGGEVDIMEFVGSIPFHNLGGVHYAWFWENNQWQSWNHGHKAAYYSYEIQQVPDPPEPGYGSYPVEPGEIYAGSSDFHTYGIDWYVDRMEFFVDDQVYHIHYFMDGDGFELDGEDDFRIDEIEGRRVAISEYSHHFEEWYPFDHKMFVILSAGVGGSNYTYGGPIEPEAEFPCSVFIDWIKVYQLEPSLTEEYESQTTSLKLFPNPASTHLKIEIEPAGEYRATFTDQSGRIFMDLQVKNGSEIDISALPAGTFIVQLFSDKMTYSRLFTKLQ